MKKAVSILIILFCVFTINAQNKNIQLLEAVKTNNFSKVKKLVEKGANVDTKDKNQATILMWAVYKSDFNIVKYLIKHKADYTKKGVIYTDEKQINYYGNLLGIAAGENKPYILKYLLDTCKINVDDLEYNPKTKKTVVGQLCNGLLLQDI